MAFLCPRAPLLHYEFSIILPRILALNAVAGTLSLLFYSVLFYNTEHIHILYTNVIHLYLIRHSYRSQPRDPIMGHIEALCSS